MKYLSRCGSYCLKCGCYGNLCKGCAESAGVVFHTGGQPCAVYSCASKQKCCDCVKAPCGVWMKTRDPSFSDELFERNVELRLRSLRAAERRKLIITPRLTVMPLKVSDAKSVFKWTGDPSVTKYMNYSLYNNVEEVEAWLKSVESKENVFGFFLHNGGELIGCGSVEKNRGGEYELGYNLAKAYWGKGYCTEASKAMLAYAAEELKVNDFVCRHAKENVRSGRVIEKCGFKYVRDGSYTCLDGKRTFADRQYELHINRFEMNVDGEWFDKIIKGEKTVELRLNDEKRREIKIGDYIALYELVKQERTGNKCVVKVTSLCSFADFNELYENTDMTECGYGKSETPNPDDMLKYYSLERQREHGVLGIGFELAALL